MKNYIYLSIGSFLIALGVVLFFISNSITTGGAPGMAILLHHLSGFSVGAMMIAFNIPLLLIGMKYLGKGFGVRTIVTIFLTSFFVDLLVEVLHVNGITENILLATLFGGVVIGIGVGFVLQGNSSAGGSTIIAKVISAHSHIKPGQVILFVDMIIVLGSIYVFKDVDKALWSILSIYVTSKCIDYMLSGGPSKKVVHITASNVEILSEKITQALGKEGSILSGTDMFNEKQKDIIFILVELGKLRILRNIIESHDENAVMVVMDASELLGRGH